MKNSYNPKVQSRSQVNTEDFVTMRAETLCGSSDLKLTQSFPKSLREGLYFKNFWKIIDCLQNKYGKVACSAQKVMVASSDTIFVDVPPFQEAKVVQSFSSCKDCWRHRTRAVFSPNPPLLLPLRSVHPKGTFQTTVPKMSQQQNKFSPRHQLGLCSGE